MSSQIVGPDGIHQTPLPNGEISKHDLGKNFLHSAASRIKRNEKENFAAFPPPGEWSGLGPRSPCLRQSNTGIADAMFSESSTDTIAATAPEFLSVRLRDKSCLRIRLLTPEDREHLVEGFSRLSRESRYTRFFSYIPSLEGPVLDKLADLSGHLHVAIGAFTENDELGHGVAVARAIQPAAGEPAELAITVVDGSQGMGLAQLLLHILVKVTANLGVERFAAEVLRENYAAVKAFRNIGASTHPDPEDMAVTLVELAPGDLTKLSRWPDDLEERIRAFAAHASVSVQARDAA